MNLLVVGASHHTAPMELLERLSVPPPELAAVLGTFAAQQHINEVVVLSTCNRVEVYAAVRAFHGGLAEICALLAERAQDVVAGLAPHLYAHYDLDATRHALRVASGLDSMVVGEAQILGQLREAYAAATDQEAAGTLLHELMQQALRVGKRVHAETGIDRAGRSVVSAALAAVPHPLAGRAALVVGAGSMGSLALATLARAGAHPLRVTSRGRERAERAAKLHGATAVDWVNLLEELSTVDLVVCATTSPEPVLTAAMVSQALAQRGPDQPGSGQPGSGQPGPGQPGAGRSLAVFDLAVVDLAVPHDVTPDVADLPGVTLINMDTVAATRLDEPSLADRAAAEEIVATEVEAFLTWLRGTEVAPTVAALRARADAVVESELQRLAARRPDLTDEQRADVAHAVHRVVRRLLHSPTVRVRQLAATPGGDQYAAALRELFDLSLPPSLSPEEKSLGRAVDIDREEVEPQ